MTLEAADAEESTRSKPQKVDSDDDDEAESQVVSAVDRVLDEWLVTGISRAAAKKFIRDKVGNRDATDCDRVRQWMLLRMNGKVWNHGYKDMVYAPENVPGLRSHHVWSRSDLPWLQQVEEHFPAILQELFAARDSSGASGFQPYRDPPHAGAEERAAQDGLGVEGVDRGMWNVLYLLLNHKTFEENCERFPVTIKAIEKAFPRSYSHAFFSALTPGSHILKHKGPSNRMLRVWLPLCGLDGFRLRVADTYVEPKAGEAFAWDHSYEHEAWHEGTETRVVLIVDIWHPDLTDAEVRFLRMLQNCRLRAGRLLTEQVERNPEDVTYFDIVEKAKHLLTDDDWWVINSERDPSTKPT
mmetsp:Transcript_22738/g.53054  ORF Transcript_22738/g.53054 Transcript_22738/m.53054 type:complete len:355 (+) Transcript_22738:121-1185(+)